MTSESYPKTAALLLKVTAGIVAFPAVLAGHMVFGTTSNDFDKKQAKKVAHRASQNNQAAL